MPELRIHYADGTIIRGPLRKRTWDGAPDDGVLHVVVMEPYPKGRRPWTGVEDRQIWTGSDDYDPRSDAAHQEAPALYRAARRGGWKTKRGTLIPDAEYHASWEGAAHGE